MSPVLEVLVSVAHMRASTSHDSLSLIRLLYKISIKRAKTGARKTWLLYLFTYHPPRNPYFLSILPWSATQSVKKLSQAKNSLCDTRSLSSRLALRTSSRMHKLTLVIFQKERFVSRRSYANTTESFQKRRNFCTQIVSKKTSEWRLFFNDDVFRTLFFRWHCRVLL